MLPFLARASDSAPPFPAGFTLGSKDSIISPQFPKFRTLTLGSFSGGAKQYVSSKYYSTYYTALISYPFRAAPIRPHLPRRAAARP